MTFLILVAGLMFGRFLALSRIPIYLTNLVKTMSVSPYLILAIIFVIYFVLGMLMDGMAILVIMTPITYPIAISLGFSGIWVGILTILMLNIGLLTPCQRCQPSDRFGHTSTSHESISRCCSHVDYPDRMLGHCYRDT
jgi:TRAP-type C4-dicarboxylate transport system permease large subunit